MIACPRTMTIGALLLAIFVSHECRAAVGRTPAEADVSSTGEATYRIPIVAPPGINGLTPELALVYAHRQEEGVAGIGWSIAGLSKIDRCAKTWAQDGAPKAIELSMTDRFCHDGVQLRLTSGTYGAAGSKYRSEIDTVARYSANGTAGNGPAWFKVEAKDGLIYEYGNSADSRIESLATGWETTARTWALSKIRDREGNEIVFSYTEDGAPNGAFRISAVKYRSNPGQGIAPGYSINFIYGTQPSGDVDTEYAAGGQIVDTKRLTRIDVLYTDPATDVVSRRYNLTYEANLSSASRSRLASVQECAGSECLSSTTFTYQNGTNGLSAETSSGTTIPSGTKPLPLDINGDGRTDLVYSSSSGTGTWRYRLANTAGGYGSAVNTGIANTNHELAIGFDYNSDGLDDILVPYSGTTWWAILGSTNGLQAPVNTGAPVTSTAGNAIALDKNGDGREDLVYAEDVGTLQATIWVRYKLSGTGFSATPTLIFDPGQGFTLLGPVFDGPFQQNRTNHFDANGDGLKDAAIRIRERFKNGDGTFTFLYDIDVILGGGVGAFNVAIDATAAIAALPIDMNGDGYTDIAYDNGQGSLKYRRSTGKSFGALASTGPSLTNLDMTKAVARDWDGDGFEDLVVPNTSTNTWHYIRSHGSSFAAPVNTTLPTSGVLSTFPIDNNGDGLHDIGYVRSSGVYVHRLHSGVKADLLKTATDGFGNKITFNYGSITQGSYNKTTGAAFPNQEYIGPIYVVTSAVPTSGIGSGTYTLTYTYEGARFHRQGRGLGGFTKKTTHDSRSGVSVAEFFNQSFPYRGRVSKYEMRQADNTLIQRVTNTWAKNTGGSGNQNYHHPYMRVSTEENFEAGGPYNGTLINKITTTVVVDTYGSPTDVTTVTTEEVSANGAQAGASFTEKVEFNSIVNNTTNWCLGRAGEVRWINSHNQPGGTQIIRTVTRVWDTTTFCRLTQEITEPASPTYKVTRALSYDAFGNIDSDTVTGVGMASRTTTINWGSDGQFPSSEINPLNQTRTFGWDRGKGVQTIKTDANGLSVSWQYDAFGRPTRETRADGTFTDYVRTSCTSSNSYCGTSYSRIRSQIRATSKRTDGTEIRFDDVFLDKLDRPVQRAAQSMGGGVSVVRTIYDTFGRIFQRSAPDFAPTPAFYTTTQYDVLNRPIQISRPIDAGTPTLQTTSISYEGLTTVITDPESKTSTKISDALGRMLRSIDHAGYHQRFVYDAFGSILSVEDANLNVLMQASYSYGIRPFRKTSFDMDMGSWSYTPNALGEVVAYSDAKGQSFTAAFDTLSRPVRRTEPDNETIWTWGASAALHNIDRLASISAAGHSESFVYDSKGRLSQRTITSDATYLINYGYDSTSGQLDSLTYPASTGGYRLKLKYGYAHGVLNRISDFNAATTVFWEANAVDARGNVIADTLGNGLQTLRGFDAVTGLPHYIQSGAGGSTASQDMEFRWNKVGSLTERKDVNRSLTENFFYDNLHRFDYSILNGVQNLDVAYDDLGNITSRSDVPGAWSYHPTKKHAVTAAGSNTFSYDANGNQTTRNGNDIVWTSYNYPSEINEGGSQRHDYFYDGNRQRWKQVYVNGATTETTIFVGGLLEKHTVGSVTEYRHYISAGGTPVALYTRQSAGNNTAEYFLLDHMGSVAAITDATGGTYVNQSFAAFGQRRDPSDWSGPPSTSDETLIADATRRGYTFHTNLGASPLIHMNGRVADALTGRFLSPDPYVPEPGMTQSWNRYSYVHNNPMTYTDPSGFIPLCFDAFSCGFELIGSIFAFWGSDSKPPPPPKGCWVDPTNCYGQAGMTRVPRMNNDLIFGMPNTDFAKTFGQAASVNGRSEIGLFRVSALDSVIGAIENSNGRSDKSDRSSPPSELTNGADKIFRIRGGREEDRLAVLDVLDSMLGTVAGKKAYARWREKVSPDETVQIDLDCTGCRERNYLAYVIRNSSGPFEVFLPTSVKNQYYPDTLGRPVPMTFEMLIAHEVFGHGFLGYTVKRHDNVIRTVNKIMQELDSDYIWHSTAPRHIDDRY